MAYGADAYGTAPYGAPGEPPEIAPPPAGLTMRVPLRITMVEAVTHRVPIRITMVEAVTHRVAVRVTMVQPVTHRVPVRITMVDPAVVELTQWCAVLTVRDADLSARLTGELTVEAEEGAARVASFTLRPVAGPIALSELTGAPVTIDLARRAPDGSPYAPRRIFTGVIDVPTYDLTSHLISCECTDQRQAVIDNLPREWIDTHVGGYYSEAVSGPPGSTLAYAESRLESVPVALDLDPFQRPRVTAWALPEPADIELDEDDLIDGSLSLQMASHSDLRNEITTRLQYRFPRLRARVIEGQFERTISEYTSQGLDIPSRAMIEQAVVLSGWERIGDINYIAVDPGVYESVGGSGVIFTSISVTDAQNLSLGFGASFVTRWVQSVTEDYTLTVRAQASIDAIGYAREQLDGATLDAAFDEAAWLDGTSTEPVLTLPPVGDVALDYGAAGTADRAAAQAAAQALIARASTSVLASHRTTRVGAAVLARADIDLDIRVAISTAHLSASGKVARVKHQINIDSGIALTDFSLAISGVEAVGLDDSDDPVAPEAPADPTPAPEPSRLACEIGFHVGQTMTSPPFDEEVQVGYFTNAKAGVTFDALAPAYPLQLTIRAPEVEAAVRDPITLPKTATYSVAIPQDTLEITAP